MANSMKVKFVKSLPQPNLGRKSVKWDTVLDQVRARPGEWGIVMEKAKNRAAAASINGGRYGGAKPGEFETATRANGDGTYRIFAGVAGTVNRDDVR